VGRNNSEVRLIRFGDCRAGKGDFDLLPRPLHGKRNVVADIFDIDLVQDIVPVRDGRAVDLQDAIASLQTAFCRRTPFNDGADFRRLADNASLNEVDSPEDRHGQQDVHQHAARDHEHPLPDRF
jgi:hypothetical protein